jgi:SAM-dependent methyltransferase
MPGSVSGRIAKAGVEYEKRLEAVRTSLDAGFPWYPYTSLTNMDHIDRLLGGDLERLLRMASAGIVLDLGCGDGDMSFFLESAGCKVHAVDHRLTNHNHMMGVRALSKALRSHVEIHDIDIDSYFRLPAPRYELALCLGILYHLKNPYYALECLARHSRYAILSTRIAGTIPPWLPDARSFTGAYLLDTRELNSDPSNFWIFTEAGLRRLLKRAGWRVIAHTAAGPAESDPWSLDRDQRMFCLVESTYSPFSGCEAETLDGWYEPEGEGWRWTKRTFSIGLRTPAEACPVALSMNVWVPEEALREGPLTLSAKVGGVSLAPEVFREAGNLVYFRRLESELPRGAAVKVEFSLDRAVGPSEPDGRELGLVVASVYVEPFQPAGGASGAR